MDPEVIKAAAASTLGILALMVILISAIALAFFRAESSRIRVLVFLLLFGGVAGFAIAVMLHDREDRPPLLQSTGNEAAPATNASAATLPSEPPAASCQEPENGVEKEGRIEQFNVDSGWRGGGSSPDGFCAGELAAQRAKLPPGETITLERSAEDSRDERPPFNVRRYLYTCTFTRRSPPVYPFALSPACTRKGAPTAPPINQMNVTATGEGVAIGQVNGNINQPSKK